LSRYRLVPPAGAPLPARSVLSSVLPDVGDRPRSAELLADRLGHRNPFFVSSGRAALTILLNALRQGSHRREVVIPAYTCFSVPSAVVRAGLTIRLCDVDPKTLDLDLNALVRLDLGRVLCIVPSGLYGLPEDLIALEQIARRWGAFLVDDAAQCFGATQQGRPCGTFGDAGFYSLGRGKGITTMGGGILVTRRDDLDRKIAEQICTLPRPSARHVGAAVASSLGYSAMLRPSLYWLVDRLPFLELGASHFEPNFPVAQLSAYQRRLAMRLLPLLDSYNWLRREHADYIRAGIEGVEGIEVPQPTEGAKPVYLRFPILTRDGRHRAGLLRRFREAGIVASPSYPTSIGEIPGIASYLAPDQAPCPNARSIATRILTLPTHSGVTPRDLEVMIGIIRGDHERDVEALR
jgi:dTDP-4-amino-4,6-dideoxygalactose transaminase